MTVRRKGKTKEKGNRFTVKLISHSLLSYIKTTQCDDGQE